MDRPSGGLLVPRPVVAPGADGGADRDAGRDVVGAVHRPDRPRRRRRPVRRDGSGTGRGRPASKRASLVVQALLRGEAVESEPWAVHGARVAPLPPEGAEWWIGGGVPKAIERAARLGDCWYGNADLTPETAHGYRDLPGSVRPPRSHPGPDPDPQGCLHRRRPRRSREGRQRPRRRRLPGVRSPSGRLRRSRRCRRATVGLRRSGLHGHHHQDHVTAPARIGADAAARSVELAADVRSRLA